MLKDAKDALSYPFPIGANGTPPPLLAEVRQARPLCPVELPSGCRVWMVTRRDDIMQVLTDPRFSRDLVYPEAPRFVGDDFTSLPGGIFNLDPPAHTRVRQVIARFYTRAGVERYRPTVQRHADALLDAMAAGPNPTDLMHAYAALLPLHTNCDILQVPIEQRRRYLDHFRTQTNLAVDAAAVASATRATVDFSRAVIDAKRGALDADEPIGALIAAEQAGVIGADELVGTVTYLFVTGSEPLVPPLGAGPITLALNQSQLQECIADPALWPQAVEELLRYHHNGVLGLPRVATEDVPLHDGVIRKGEAVCAPMLGATWDPRHYHNPGKFNIHRPTDGTMTFGAGPHFCLGAALTRMFLHVAFQSLYRRFPTLTLAVPVEEIPWESDLSFIKPACLPVGW